MAILLRDKLHNGPAELKQAYGRLAMREVSVKDKEIRITGSKTALARPASGALEKSTPRVLSLVENGAPDRNRTCDLCLRRGMVLHSS